MYLDYYNEDDNEVESNQYEEDRDPNGKKRVTNNSKKTIYFKPEKSFRDPISGKEYHYNQAYPIKPGESWNYPVDGIKTGEGEVIKFPAMDHWDVDIEIRPGGGLEFSSWIYEKIVDSGIRAGELDIAPDESWDDLFNSDPNNLDDEK
ncbi:MAG: hypothetical protein ACEPOV_10330 [Hyphomicrobiales bacterium]